jgi:hypothetical protein
MAVLALLSVIALRCALVVHSEEHATNASLDAYDDYDSARPPGQKRPPGQLLLQLQNRFMLADSQIAQVFKARHADPEKLSASMNHHIQLVKDVAHQYFEQFPADYVGGIDALGKGLFKDLSVPLKGHSSVRPSSMSSRRSGWNSSTRRRQGASELEATSACISRTAYQRR